MTVGSEDAGIARWKGGMGRAFRFTWRFRVQVVDREKIEVSNYDVFIRCFPAQVIDDFGRHARLV
jgi:hypothetical protein